MNWFIRIGFAVMSLFISDVCQAGVIFGTSGSNVSITLTQDINFTATAAPDGFTRFVFEDAYSVSPGIGTFDTISNTIGLKLNGVPIGGLTTNSLWGPLSFNLGQIDGNDFTISFVGTVPAVAGDIVTLTAGSAVTNAGLALLPDLNPVSVMMVGNGGNALSAAVPLSASSVPEPSTLLLFGAGIMGLGAMYGRRRANA
jgi:hypothetical protein